MNQDQEERLVAAFESIAGCLTSISRTLELAAEKQFPTKKKAEPMTITYVKTEEEQIVEDQGGTGETTVEDWLSLGPRERRYLEQAAIRDDSKTRD